MSEARLTKQCHKYFTSVRKERPDFYFQKISDRFTGGIPDYYILFRGISCWIELKDEGEEPRPLQQYTLRALQKAGAMTLWTDDFDEVKELVETLINQGHRL